MAIITKRNLVVSISSDSGLSQQQVGDVLEHFLDAVTGHLADGNQVVLHKFGAFRVKRIKASSGRKPSPPGSGVSTSERTIIEFEPAMPFTVTNSQPTNAS